MASRLDNISKLFSNFRTRSIIIVTLAILGLAILVGIIRLVKASGQSNTATSTELATAPSQATVPGLNPTSPEYTQLQQQLNQQRLQQAEQSGGSSIPTLTYQNADSTTQSTTPEENVATSETPPAVDPQIAALQAQVAAQNQQIQQANAAQIQQATTDKSGAMRSQAQQLLQAWGQSPNQVYTVGLSDEQRAAAAGLTPNNDATNGSEATQLPVPIKAGDIQFAVLNTEVNSDEPGPVMATIVMGPYKGAKLLGSLGAAKTLPGTNGAEAVVIQFNIMSFAGIDRSIGISAVAIDPDTARTALASDVDHHYLLRYGSLFASSFLEGYGSAAAQAGSTVTQNSDGGVFTTYPDANPKREVASAFGQVGQNWGEQLGQTYNRPNTVTVHAGAGMGILYLTDVLLNTTPSTKILQAISTKNAQDEVAANNVSAATATPIAQAQNQLITAVPDAQGGQQQ